LDAPRLSFDSLSIAAAKPHAAEAMALCEQLVARQAAELLHERLSILHGMRIVTEESFGYGSSAIEELDGEGHKLARTSLWRRLRRSGGRENADSERAGTEQGHEDFAHHNFPPLDTSLDDSSTLQLSRQLLTDRQVRRRDLVPSR
jgi:hypothetical protein